MTSKMFAISVLITGISILPVQAENIQPEETLVDADEVWGTRRGEELYRFRSENSRSEFLTSSYNEVPVQLHYRVYENTELSQDSSRSAMVFFPGLRAPEVKHSWIIESLWQSQKNTDFYVLDIRSHGRSASIDDNWLSVHAESYEEFVYDFRVFIEHVARQRNYEKIVVSAHSTAAFLILLTLKRYPEIQQHIEKVVLTSPAFLMAPDIIGDINNFGRIPIGWAANIVQMLLKTGRVNPQSIAPGYPKTYRLFNPRRVRNMVHDIKFYWAYRRWVELEQEVGDPYPFMVERTGPSVQWILEMAKAHQEIATSDLSEIEVPIEMLTASKDMLVDNRFTTRLCQNLTHCHLQQVEGYHEFPFDREDVASPFYSALKNPFLQNQGSICSAFLSNRLATGRGNL